MLVLLQQSHPTWHYSTREWRKKGMKKALCHSLIADRRSRVPRRPPLLVNADIKSVKRTSRSQHQDLRWVVNTAALYPNLAKSLGIPELLLYQPILRFWPNIDRFRCPKPDRAKQSPFRRIAICDANSFPTKRQLRLGSKRRTSPFGAFRLGTFQI